MDKFERVKRSEALNFVGEIFYEEMQFILGGDTEKKFWVKKHGMNSRAFSKDVIDISSYNYMTNDDMKEAVFVHLSRNSIYHQLPESFFHPLVISSPSMSNAEIVDAIKTNRSTEKDNIHFFIPFDTEIFEKKVKLTNRYINIFTDQDSKKVLFNLARKIIDKDIPLTKEQYYKLFLNLCQAENYKENFSELENLLKSIMGYKIRLSYQKKVHKNSPFSPIGSGILAHTFGLQGETISEFEDVEATMIVEENLDYKTIKKHMEIIEKILEYFVFSNRSILVNYQTTEDNSIVLGENYLGYNTVLIAS